MSGLRSSLFQQTPGPVFTTSLRATVGGLGSREGQMDNASSLALLSDGNVAVTDTNNRRVQVFDLDGKFQRAIGAKILQSPWGVAAIKDKFYVTDGGKENKVHVFHNDGRAIRYFDCVGVLEACCIAVSPVTGSIVVTDYASPEVAIYHPETHALVRSFRPPPLDEMSEERPIPEHVAVSGGGSDGEECIFLSFGGASPRVHKYNMAGELLLSFGSFGCPAGVHVTPRGSVLVLDREKRTLSVYDVHGRMQQQLLSSTSGMHLFPHSVVVANGKIVVVVGSPEPFGLPSKLAIYALKN